jgi:hypothetical protein
MPNNAKYSSAGGMTYSKTIFQYTQIQSLPPRSVTYLNRCDGKQLALRSSYPI